MVRNGSTFQFAGADVKATSPRSRSTAPARGSRTSRTTALRTLHTNDATGKLALRNGRNFTRTGSFTNNGVARPRRLGHLHDHRQLHPGRRRAPWRPTSPAPWRAPATASSRSATSRPSPAPWTSTSAPIHRRPATFFDVVSAATRNGTFATVIGDGFDVTYPAGKVRVRPAEHRDPQQDGDRDRCGQRRGALPSRALLAERGAGKRRLRDRQRHRDGAGRLHVDQRHGHLRRRR